MIISRNHFYLLYQIHKCWKEKELLSDFTLLLNFLSYYLILSIPGYEELVMYRSINIQCTENGITILLTKKHLPSFDHSSFHLNNNSCTGHQLNHSHIILETGLSDCGTIKRSFNDSYDVHTNLVQGHLKNLYNGRSKNITTRFAVECNPPSAPATRNETPQSDTNLRKVVSKEVYVKDEPLAKTRPPLLANEGKLILSNTATERQRHLFYGPL